MSDGVIERLMSIRSQKGMDKAMSHSGAGSSGESENQKRIRMFENIENGSECRCPACMGLFLGLGNKKI